MAEGCVTELGTQVGAAVPDSRLMVALTEPTPVFLDINCGRCGTPLKVRLADLGEARFVKCEQCATKPPFTTRQVFVVFEARPNERSDCR